VSIVNGKIIELYFPVIGKNLYNISAHDSSMPVNKNINPPTLIKFDWLYYYNTVRNSITEQ